jgi:hypothetical protein
MLLARVSFEIRLPFSGNRATINQYGMELVGSSRGPPRPEQRKQPCMGE